MTDENKQTWIYMGLRQSFDGKKLLAYWLTEDGEESAYTYRRGSHPRIIGASYGVAYNEEDKTALFDRDRANQDIHPDASQWWAAEHGAKSAQARRSAEKRLSTEGPLEDALNELADAYAKIKSYDDKAGFLSYVESRIARGPRRK